MKKISVGDRDLVITIVVMMAVLTAAILLFVTRFVSNQKITADSQVQNLKVAITDASVNQGLAGTWNTRQDATGSKLAIDFVNGETIVNGLGTGGILISDGNTSFINPAELQIGSSHCFETNGRSAHFNLLEENKLVVYYSETTTCSDLINYWDFGVYFRQVKS